MDGLCMRDKRARFGYASLGALALALAACDSDGAQADDESSVARRIEPLREKPSELRDFIAQQVGGLDKLQVPGDDQSIPLPPEDPARPGRYRTTEAKRFLGKMLFHDPIRTVRINVNQGVNPPIRDGEPRDLPEGTAFGGTIDAANPNVQRIVDATKSTGSCGSCHLSEAAGKAGAVFNFNVGGEGRGYTDEHGKFIVRRRPMQGLVPRASDLMPRVKLFEGDTGVDALPTLTDIYMLGGAKLISTPARQKVDPLPEELIATGRLDQLDSVGRQSPSMVGFAFNNRLLLGGFAGESNASEGGLNPLNDPAQENLTLLLLDAHRMLDSEALVLQKIPAFVELFRQAFPEEARAYNACKEADASAACQSELDKLVNDDSVLRATATFLRTAVTRDTPFDRFLAGEDALSARQQSGAKLFFTRADQGGAGCFSCHSGPMLNKQAHDPDVAGIGELVEENFINVGIGDHPLQALNALQRGHLKLDGDGKPMAHGEDTGRQEITHNPDHAYKFRSVTLRQLKDARTFFHNGSLSNLREVVSYFNKGVAQDQEFAGQAGTLDERFTHPRGKGAPAGLGLSDEQMDALADFLEEGLYDPSFAHDFALNEADLEYSKNLGDLATLGARDGQLLSGLANDNNDPLSRRDQGLELLDVTKQIEVERSASECVQDTITDVYELKNTSESVVDTHLLVIVKGLRHKVQLKNRSGMTRDGDPYIRVFLKDGVLQPGQSFGQQLVFAGASNEQRPSYTLSMLSGQGKP